MPTILVVDDEEQLRQYMARALENAGYKVLLAGNGLEAIALVNRQTPRVHLLITDVLMPVMSGPELVACLAEQVPYLPVLYVTGGHGGSDITGPVLWKPFLPAELTGMVRLLLIGNSEPTGILEGCK